MDEKVLDTLRMAVRLSPDSVPLRLHLAQALSEAQLWDEAAQHYQAALQAEPGNLQTLIGLGLVLHGQGKHEEAAARLAEALRSDNKSAEAHLAMARVLLALKQQTKAQKSYQMAMDIDPLLHDAT